MFKRFAPKLSCPDCRGAVRSVRPEQEPRGALERFGDIPALLLFAVGGGTALFGEKSTWVWYMGLALATIAVAGIVVLWRKRTSFYECMSCGKTSVRDTFTIGPSSTQRR